MGPPLGEGWERRPKPLTLDELEELAAENGLVVPEFVRLVCDDRFLPPNANAHYSAAFSSDKTYAWTKLLRDGKLVVRIRSSVLFSPEKSLHVLAHEVHELAALHELFSQRGTIPGRELIDLVRTDMKGRGNLHHRADEAADELVLRYRAGRSVKP